jgi:hypothetical protein
VQSSGQYGHVMCAWFTKVIPPKWRIGEFPLG